MLFKTHIAFQHRLAYSNAEGRWIAELKEPVHIRVEDASLERCRRLAVDALDDRLAAWIAGSELTPSVGEEASGGTRRA